VEGCEGAARLSPNRFAPLVAQPKALRHIFLKLRNALTAESARAASMYLINLSGQF
jgi:hypothetical protein